MKSKQKKINPNLKVWTLNEMRLVNKLCANSTQDDD